MGILYDLIQQAQMNNKQAQHRLIEMFEPKIKKCTRLMPNRDREDVEQELRMEVLRRVTRFNTENTPGFWEFVEKQSSESN